MKHAVRWLVISVLYFPFTAQADICRIFPTVAQSHSPTAPSGGGAVTLSEAVIIEQTLNQPSDKLTLGFNPSSSTIRLRACRNGSSGPLHRCELVRDKIVKPLPNIELFNENGPLAVIERSLSLGSAGECKVLNTAQRQCSYGDLTLSNGTLTLAAGRYWFNNITFSGISTLAISGNVEINAQSISVNKSSMITTDGLPDDVIFKLKGRSSFDGNSAINALVYAEDAVDFLGNVVLTGAATVKTLGLSNNAKIVGKSQCLSLAKYQLSLAPSTDSASLCQRIPITFNITDEQQLIQSKIAGTLSVSASTSTNTACWSTSANGQCSASATQNVALQNGRATLWLENRAAGTVNVSAGFSSEATGQLSVNNGQYSFSAGDFGFSASSKQMVAGKPQLLTIEAFDKSCNTIDVAYTGTKILEIGAAEYISPSYASSSAPKKPIIADVNSSGTISVEFVQGRATDALTVTYPDVGIVSLPIKDVTPVQPPEVISNGSDGTADDAALVKAVPLSGEAVIHVRPYTFAMCDLLANKGASPEVDALTVAGAAFSLSLKPVIWMPSDGNIQSGAVVALDANFCQRSTTPSFNHATAPKANVSINKTGTIVLPESGKNATLSGVTNIANTNGLNNVYRFSDLKVDEVGTFKFRSALSATYLGMIVNPSEFDLGRFYPSHFALTPSFSPGVPASVVDSVAGFTYMGQPFFTGYVIQAMTVGGTAVSNYHRFSLQGEKATFADWVINSGSAYPYTGVDLTERWQLHPALDPVNPWSMAQNETSEVRKSALTSSVVIKGDALDAPSLLRFAVGVAVADRDGTQFKFCDQAAQIGCSEKVSKPGNGSIAAITGAQFAKGEFLFGLMRIQGFTETQNLSREGTLPVTIEYYNGRNFAVNLRDNVSMISTNVGFAHKTVLFSDVSDIRKQAQILLRDDAQNVVTTKTVKKGRSLFNVLAPNQNPSLNREQFRYDLKLGEVTSGDLRQPWLQHNWQGATFDDDPSAIGTYGFYRGSDRIIYRGEKNTTVAEE